DGGHLTPGGERVDALRHRPPHAPRTGEILTRAGVVDDAVAGRGDTALNPAHRLRDVEVRAVQVGDGGVGELLHPLPEGVLASDVAGRVGVEHRHRLVDGRA